MNDNTTPRPLRKAFTLVELIVVVVVLGILASIAIVGYKTVVDKSLESKQMLRMTQILKEAKVLYTQKTYTDPLYSWNQAVADAVDDLPVYSSNAWSEGVSAYGGSNLNVASNSWIAQQDTGDAVYSVAPNDIVVSNSYGVVYVASAISSTRGVFGTVSQTSAVRVWAAACSGASCDAESAAAGPPAGGAYAAGSTAPTTTAAPTVASAPTIGTPTLSHPSIALAFSAPASTGGSTITSYTGTCASSNGGVTRSASSATSPITVSSLDAGKNYSCTVTATNGVGSSPASSTRTVTSSASYSCPSGGSLSGSTCTQTVASYSYSCPPGGTLSGGTCYAPYGSEAYGPGIGCNTNYGWYDYGGGCAFTAYSSVSYSYPTYTATTLYSYTVT